MVPLARWATSADLTSLLPLYTQLNPEDPQVGDAAANSAWKAIMACRAVGVIVAEAEGRAVSSCVLVVVPNLTRAARPWSVIENVVTDAAYRRRGFGTAVLRFAREAAIAAGCYKVMLATGNQDTGTLRFYEGAGFTRVDLTCFQTRFL
jgi:ribosomal protein S18 acetylase RimI-like enzyme